MSERVNDVTPMPSSGPTVRAKEPSAYTPSTEEVRECWATQDDIGNPYEMDEDVDERHREKDGEFDRWLAEHDREVLAWALWLGRDACMKWMQDKAYAPIINPYESEEK